MIHGSESPVATGSSGSGSTDTAAAPERDIAQFESLDGDTVHQLGDSGVKTLATKLIKRQPKHSDRSHCVEATRDAHRARGTPRRSPSLASSAPVTVTYMNSHQTGGPVPVSDPVVSVTNQSDRSIASLSRTLRGSATTRRRSALQPSPSARLHGRLQLSPEESQVQLRLQSGAGLRRRPRHRKLYVPGDRGEQPRVLHRRRSGQGAVIDHGLEGRRLRQREPRRLTSTGLPHG